MPISLVQSKTGVSTSASVSPSFDTAPTSGNLIVLAFVAADVNATPDSGWTQSTGLEQVAFHASYIWWRLSNASNPPGSYTIGSALESAWILMEFSSINSSPYSTSNGQIVQDSVTSYTTPTITPAAGNIVLVASIGFSNNSNLSASTITGWTNSFTSIANSGTSTGGTNHMLGTAYRLVTADGSTGYSTGGTLSSGASNSRSGLIIAFKEASASSTDVIQSNIYYVE